MRSFLVRNTFSCNVKIFYRIIESEKWNFLFEFNKYSNRQISVMEQDNTEFMFCAIEPYQSSWSVIIPLIFNEERKQTFTFDDLLFDPEKITIIQIDGEDQNLVANFGFIRQNKIRIVNLSSTKDVIVDNSDVFSGYGCIEDDVIIPKSIIVNEKRRSSFIDIIFVEGSNELYISIVDDKKRIVLKELMKNERIIYSESGIFTYNDLFNCSDITLYINKKRNGTYYLYSVDI